MSGHWPGQFEHVTPLTPFVLLKSAWCAMGKEQLLVFQRDDKRVRYILLPGVFRLFLSPDVDKPLAGRAGDLASPRLISRVSVPQGWLPSFPSWLGSECSYYKSPSPACLVFPGRVVSLLCYDLIKSHQYGLELRRS